MICINTIFPKVDSIKQFRALPTPEKYLNVTTYMVFQMINGKTEPLRIISSHDLANQIGRLLNEINDVNKIYIEEAGPKYILYRVYSRSDSKDEGRTLYFHSREDMDNYLEQTSDEINYMHVWRGNVLGTDEKEFSDFH